MSPSIHMIGMGILEGHPVRWSKSAAYMQTTWMERQTPQNVSSSNNASGTPMSEISRIEITHHQLPLEPAFPASWDTKPRTKFPATIVRVFDAAGNVGIGSGDAS
jgi:hypothetical protein